MTTNDSFPARFLLRLPVDQAQAVTEFRTERQLPSESAAFRTLIKLGLKAAAAEQGAPA